MTKNIHNKPSLGRIWHRKNSQTGKIFLSGSLKIDKGIIDRFMTPEGITIDIVGNKALKLDKNGDGYYVLFENDHKSANKSVPQAKVFSQAPGKTLIDDEEPF